MAPSVSWSVSRSLEGLMVGLMEMFSPLASKGGIWRMIRSGGSIVWCRRGCPDVWPGKRSTEGRTCWRSGIDGTLRFDFYLRSCGLPVYRPRDCHPCVLLGVLSPQLGGRRCPRARVRTALSARCTKGCEGV